MLWKFRKEFILIFFVLIGLFIIHKKDFFYKGYKPKSFPVNNISVDNLIRINQQLEDLLKLRKQFGTSKTIYATVVEISPWVYPSTIKIDKGWSSGVKNGMAIVSRSGYLVGRITDVAEDYSFGDTLFNSDTRVSVVVASTGETGILEGGRFPSLRVKFLPPQSNAVNGDNVITSKFTQLFPPDIPVGKIIKVKFSGYEFVAEGWIKPLFYYDGLENVAIIK